MVQAARSGVQNIPDGSKVSGTSKKMELNCALLDPQIERLTADFERESGFTEQLYRVRRMRRD